MATETAHHGEAASSGLPQFAFETWASQIFWLAITFGILYFVLSKLILPKIETGLTLRGDRIADNLDEAERMNREAQQAELDYNQAVADAKAKALTINEATRKSLDAEISANAAEAEIEINRKVSDAEAHITEIRSKAMSKVDDVALDTIGDILAKVANVTVSQKAIRTAILKVKG